MLKASDLQSQDFDDPKFLIHGLIPEGITLLSGSPKIGKSWMLLAFGSGVATGGVVLSEYQCAKAKCLYLALEDTPRRLQQRLRIQMGWDPFPEDLLLQCEWPRFPSGIKALESVLQEDPDIRLVLIDTLEMVRPPRRSNPYEDDYRAVSGLRELATQYRVGFVVVHHNRKSETNFSGEEVDPLERVSGTMGLTGSVDNILVLSRVRGTSLGELFVMGRDVQEHKATLKFDSQLGAWHKYEKIPKY